MSSRPLTTADAARVSLACFAGYIDTSWRAYRHLRLICRELEDVAFGRTKRLLITAPPQHGKSLCVSRALPAWVLGRWPDRRVVLASYEATTAERWGREVRDVLEEHGRTLFGIRPRRDLRSAASWAIEGRRGGMHTCGVGGALTGRPADLLVIDDPVRSHEDAVSDVYCTRNVEWFRRSAVTRLSKDGAIVQLQTRWSDTDLAGWILANEGARWRVLNLPALAEENDPLGRAHGEPLCPELHPLEQLLENQATQGSYAWSALYQGRPVPATGGLFKREHARYYDEPTAGTYRFLETGSATTRDLVGTFVTVDTATSAKTSADHTAIAAWGLSHGLLMLLDLDLRRIEGPEIMRAIKVMCSRWRTVPYVEDTTGSKHLLAFMAQQGVAFRRVLPGSADKFTRALPASALWEQGRIVTPVRAPWLAAFERQLYAFTGREGGEDDVVDCLSMAANVVRDAGGNFWRGSAPEPTRPQNHVEASSLGGSSPVW